MKVAIKWVGLGYERCWHGSKSRLISIWFSQFVLESVVIDAESRVCNQSRRRNCCKKWVLACIELISWFKLVVSAAGSAGTEIHQSRRRGMNSSDTRKMLHRKLRKFWKITRNLIYIYINIYVTYPKHITLHAKYKENA